jgi:localization factor PodJL
MKLGVPWSVKGIRPEARETAKQAARRAGMPLSEWLNSVIINSAAEQGVDDDDELFADNTGEELGTVNAKLDALSQRLERLSRGPEAYAPPHLRSAVAAPPAHGPQAYAPPAYSPPPAYAAPPAPPMPPPARPWQGGLDTAVAEIAARRRTLNGEPPQPTAARTPAMRPAAPEQPPVFAEPPAIVRAHSVPAQDLSGLEEQLRQITDRIDMLQSPGVEAAINALRGELADITGALNNAMPRQAIDAIERQIQSLSHRIAEGRQNGGDGHALANLESGLTEIREALRNLTPAENLAGFHDAIELLGQKIDYVVAQKDPVTLDQLENAINTLRQVSSHIASNETVSRLASDVQMLAEKIDRFAHVSGGDALNGLEARIAALSDALAQRSQNGVTVPPKLEALVGSLSDKIEKLQSSRGGDVAFGHLEDRIVKLVEKLDASDSRLGHLETIERGLADLLVNMESMRGQSGKGLPEGGGDVHGLKQDIARTQGELESLHGALSIIMDRLGKIEQGIRAPVHSDDIPLAPGFGRVAARAVPVEHIAPAPIPSPPIAPAQPHPPAAMPQAEPSAPIAAARPMPKPAPKQEAPKRALPRAKTLPINPDLPPDEPLEPGSLSRLRADPASRIAASEAALGDAIPPGGPAPEGKSGFLAAARRAAQAALRDTSKTKSAPPPAPDYADEDESAGDKPALKKRLFGRVKSLFVSASVIAIVIGGLHIGARDLNLFKKDQPSEPTTELASHELSPAEPVQAEPATTGSIIASPAPAPRLPGMIPPPSQFGYSALSPSSTTMLPETAMSSVPSLGIGQSNDITGSLSRHPSTTSLPNAEELPTSIGGPNLRNAAANGDPSAAYEIGVRFAEGRGVAANAAESARWFERAARAGLAPAQFRLGSLYEKGIGVRKDIDKAKRSYIAAASQGNAKAMHNLAVLYAEGAGGKPDYQNAAQWFRKAASYGVADSQYNLGILYARGLGMPKDFAESYKWFSLAATSGDKEAVKKRDDVAAQIEPGALAALQNTVKSWAPERQPPLATSVTEPAGGWDAKPAAAAKPTKTSSLDARR